MAARIPRWPNVRHDEHSQDKHFVALRQLKSAHGDAVEVLDQFTKRKGEIEANPDLSATGRQKAMRQLGAQFIEKLLPLERRIGEARAYHDQLRADLAGPREDESKLPAHELVERAFRKDRIIRRFEALPLDKQREAVRVAIQKGDREILAPLIAEPGLLDAVTVQMAANSIARKGNPLLFARLEEVGGKLGATGEVEDPTESPLAVASFTLGEVRAAIEQEAGGVDPLVALQRAGVVISDAAVALPHDLAGDADAYRLARDFAAEQGKVFTILPEGAAAAAEGNGSSGGQG